MAKKKIGIVVGVVVALLVAAGVGFFALSNPGPREQRIASYLYTDQPIKALREIKLLLLFHPDHVFGKRMYDLLTKRELNYP